MDKNKFHIVLLIYQEQVSTLKVILIADNIKRSGRMVTRKRKAFKQMKKPNDISCRGITYQYTGKQSQAQTWS